MFKKGQPRPKNSGRKKGSVNKSTELNKEIMQKLVEYNADNIQEWLTRTAVRQPHKALELYLKIAEFVTPKAKVEIEMNSKVITVDVKED